MMKKGTLIEWHKTFPKFDGESFVEGDGQTFVAFQWARLSDNQYLIVIPKTLKKETGDKFAIISARRFGRLISNRN